MSYYVYILACNDNTFYTGYTTNIRRRINSHNGVNFWPGAKYTKSRRPVFLQHLEMFSTREDALSRELKIKELSHNEKQELIKMTKKEDILSAI